MLSTKQIATVALAWPWLVGCAATRPVKPLVEDVSKQHHDRKTEIIGSFEKKRDAAQFEAAMVRWQEGDAEGSQELVSTLLSRSPKHRGGRLLRAEFRLVEEKPELAIADIEALVDEDPDDAEAAHLLGLLLEASGRQQEALVHFERATQISPDSGVFAASFQTALIGEPAGQAFGAKSVPVTQSQGRR